MIRRPTIPVIAVAAGMLVVCLSPVFGAKVHQTTLDNGMDVYIVQDALTDITGAHIALDISMADIPQKKTGIRSLIQQLLIDRLNEQVAVDGPRAELGEAIRGGGDIRISAETEFVQAGFSVPSDDTQAALEAFADLFFDNVSFSSESIAAAKETVIKDIESSLDQASFRTYQLFLDALYGKGPLNPDMAARLTGLGALTGTDIVSCRRTLYTPERGYLTVVSSLPVDTVKDMVTAAFAGYERGSANAPKVMPGIPDASRVEIGESGDLKHASMFIGVPLPPYGTRKFTAGQIAYLMLAGEGGRISDDEMVKRGFGLMLPERIYEKQPPFEMISPSPMSTPFIAVHIIANPRNVEDARRQVLGHMLAIARGRFDRMEFEQARDQLLNQFARATETYEGRAQLVNLNALFGGDPASVGEFVSYISTISRDEVEAVAAEYFRHHAIGIQMPGD